MILNGEPLDNSRYSLYHKRRIGFTLKKLHQVGARRIVEVGGHPWCMTSSLVDDPQFDLAATVSAEELTQWPDEIPVTSKTYTLQTAAGRKATFSNYSGNIERTRFSITERPDTVLACEIIEHLIRAPHVMLLNINHWLPDGGKVMITTPNGAAFQNVFRIKSPTAGYRAHTYMRHSYLYTLPQLIDLVSLCGFAIVEAGYKDMWPRTGLSSACGWFGTVPFSYCRAKFKQMIYVIAEKCKHQEILDSRPVVYAADLDWEFIRA